MVLAVVEVYANHACTAGSGDARFAVLVLGSLGGLTLAAVVLDGTGILGVFGSTATSLHVDFLLFPLSFHFSRPSFSSVSGLFLFRLSALVAFF